MGSIYTSMELFGTREAVMAAKDVDVGDFTCRIASGSVRSLRWQGVEILRGLEVSIRDENWGTYAQNDVEENWEESSNLTKFIREFTVANGALTGKLFISFDPVGQITTEVTLTAHKGFSTNRAGFTLLHPLVGVSGTGLRVTHSKGEIQKAKFPKQVSPHQPFFDIAKMDHRVGHVDVSMAFEGETFEMEDHRNWTDASFKTYCRPLAKPFPYIIESGETVRQIINISVTGHLDEAAQQSQTHPCNVHVDRSKTTNIVAPQILLATEQNWLPDLNNQKIIRTIHTDGLLVRLDENSLENHTWLNSIAELTNTTGADCDVEIIVPSNVSPQSYLNQIATVCSKQKITPRHVIAVPKGYLKTFSQSGPKPAGPSPEECMIAAQIAFPKSKIGAGMLTNFTELNRTRPVLKRAAYITHGTSAIVHAADDVSIFETLEALPQIFETTKVFSPNLPSRLGLMSIGMRSNPYGDGVAPNPQNIRKAMAQNDPRQAGLFGAAFGIGIAACAADAGCQALALAATAGPFSISNGEKLFPIFHAVKALTDMSGENIVALGNLGPHIYGLATRKSDGSIRAIIANCSIAPKQVPFYEQVRSICLDEASFTAASSDMEWLANTPKTSCKSVSLGPCALAFVEMGAA